MDLKEIRDLIYKEDHRSLILLHRRMDRNIVRGNELDSVCVDLVRSYLLKHYPLWFLSGYYRERKFGDPYKVPRGYGDLPQLTLDFAYKFLDHCDPWFNAIVCNGAYAGCSSDGLNLCNGSLEFEFSGVPFSKGHFTDLHIHFRSNYSVKIWGTAYFDKYTPMEYELDTGRVYFKYKYEYVLTEYILREAATALQGIEFMIDQQGLFDHVIKDDKLII